MEGISVIIPCYNREAFLREAIESVLEQEYSGPIEIIVADDGSTDRSVETATSFGPPVIVIKKPIDCTSQGAGTTRNRAIAASKYPLIAFLDSDDLFLPGHLQRLAEVLLANLDVGLVFDEAKTLIAGRTLEFPYPEWFKRAPDASAVLLEPLPPTNAMMIHRRVLSELVGPFDSDLVYSEDIDFRLRIAEKFPVRFVSGFGSVIREHSRRSIVVGRGKKLFYYDMLVLTKAITRYSYPEKIIKAKKAKLFFLLSLNEFQNNKYHTFISYLLYSFLQSPYFYFYKINQKYFKNNEKF